MKYTITTYEDNGKEIVSRDYIFGGVISGETLESILSDSLDYLAEQEIDNKDMAGFEGTLEALDNLKIR